MNGTNSTRLKFFKINSKGRVLEEIGLLPKQRIFLTRILGKHQEWFREVGYDEEIYHRLYDILLKDRYYEWDKDILNDVRKTWMEGLL